MKFQKFEKKQVTNFKWIFFLKKKQISLSIYL